MDKKIVVEFAPSIDVKRIMKSIFECEKYRCANYEPRNKSDRKRDRKNRWR